jgi:16S rRNA (uracil1498-N3)-methyltransferase
MIFRIYQAIELAPGIEINLDKTAVNHVANVLRLKVNDPLIIFNGKGGEYSAEIIQVKRREVKVQINKFQNINRESNLKIHLAQGVSLGEKMDFILQKATELGVTKITPIITARCNVKLSKDRWNKKISRWQKILISACEQCGRNVLPKLHQEKNFADFVAENKTETKIILDPNGSLSSRGLTAGSSQYEVFLDPAVKPRDDNIGEITTLIGPEGGFTDEEIKLAEQHNFLGIKLGPRILRTETAGLVMISILQSQYGDL